MNHSIFHPRSFFGLGLCALLACATRQPDVAPELHRSIPIVDPTPEFEHDPVADDSHSIDDLHSTIAAINPEFAALLRDTGVAGEFARDGALHTVFVPSPEIYTPALFAGDEAERRKLARYYVLAGRMTSSELTNLQEVPTTAGAPLEIFVDDAETFFAVNQARVVKPNVEATDGIIHQVDAMLLPPDHADAGALRDESPTAYVRVSVEIVEACSISQPRAFFGFDSSRLRASAYDALAALAECVTSGPLAGQRLLIEGFTDPRGTRAYNESLGAARAHAVEEYLVGHGVLGSQLALVSHGESRAHDDLPMFWDFDRRVDISLAAELSR